MQRYNPKDIETKWQDKWEADKIYQASDSSTKPKKYILEYFPYPSGAAMHVGHVRNYTIGDVMARYNRMNGYNVLHPMGWDAFGLPAENYAIKNQVSPRVAIDQNTTRFKEQLMQMGFSYDWSREIDSTDPAYYRWTQWFFLFLFKKGLAYQKESLQWWCPHDKTVLANEQVEAGLCWRCGNQVEKKLLKQWFFKITDYADRLLDDLDDLDWSDAIKAMQRNWIGRSTGAEIKFLIPHDDSINGDYSFKEYSDFMPDVMHDRGSYYASGKAHRAIGETYQVGSETSKLVTSIAKITAINSLKFSELEAIHKESILKSEPGVADSTEFTKYDYQRVADVLTVFTTRPDTLFGATFLVVSPEHPQLASLTTAEQKVEVEAYIQAAQAKSDIERQETDREKTGVFTGAYALNPASGQKIPVWVADYVLAGYGTGAIMAVPAHDERDWAFAKKFDLPITRVVQNDTGDDECSHAEGVMVNSGDYDGLSSSEMREAIVKVLAVKERGSERVNYKIRDWLISRQRYWGAPIPIIHCPEHGAVAVPEDQLPVLLPELTKFEPSGDGHSPLANVPEFVNTTCPTCGGPAERETDTMDGFACSSWYFLRFADPHNNAKPFDDAKVRQWLSVDEYIGGAEHAVMHLLYARFWTKVMYDAGLINFQEPFTKLRNHGMILAPDGNKMSKSKGNTIEPGVLIDQGYGADSIRVMELFIGPWNQAANWSVEGMGGAYRFLQRTWTLVGEFTEREADTDRVPFDDTIVDTDLMRVIHKAIKKVGLDLQNMNFNTALSAQMECLNALYKLKDQDEFVNLAAWRYALETFLQILAPFAPHIAEELWQQLGHSQSIHLCTWPAYQEQYLIEVEMTIVVQVNGKVRAELVIASNAEASDVEAAALAEPKIQSLLVGKTIRKTIYVPGKLVSLVI